jgi:hypothetical protein
MNTEQPQGPEAKRIAALYRRRETTKWTAKEIKAFRYLLPIDPDDLQVVEQYYRAESRKRDNYCRRDLLTFLNNFPGEVDRARLWLEKQKKKEEDYF